MGVCFFFLFYLAYVSALVKIYLGNLKRDKHKHPLRGIAATALVHVKFVVQSCLKINTCVCVQVISCVVFNKEEKKKQNLVRSK